VAGDHSTTDSTPVKLPLEIDALPREEWDPRHRPQATPPDQVGGCAVAGGGGAGLLGLVLLGLWGVRRRRR
jgi:MYXO-CTERM domain-containing protein